MSVKVECPYFEGYKCRSEGNRKKCIDSNDKMWFYKCADLNSRNNYKEAIAHYKQTDFDVRSEIKPRETFPKRNDNCNMEKSINTTKRKENNYNEDFLCRCWYLCATGKCTSKTCERAYNDLNTIYHIVDYQIPPRKGSCGRVDLVIEGENKIFLTEVKPPKGNNETLLRMICEILSHSAYLVKNTCYYRYIEEEANPDYRCEIVKGLDGFAMNIFPAILFFKGSPQEVEYHSSNTEIDEIIKDRKIKVFVCDKDTMLIEALN